MPDAAGDDGGGDGAREALEDTETDEPREERHVCERSRVATGPVEEFDLRDEVVLAQLVGCWLALPSAKVTRGGGEKAPADDDAGAVKRCGAAELVESVRAVEANALRRAWACDESRFLSGTPLCTGATD